MAVPRAWIFGFVKRGPWGRDTRKRTGARFYHGDELSVQSTRDLKPSPSGSRAEASVVGELLLLNRKTSASPSHAIEA